MVQPAHSALQSTISNTFPKSVSPLTVLFMTGAFALGVFGVYTLTGRVAPKQHNELTDFLKNGSGKKLFSIDGFKFGIVYNDQKDLWNSHNEWLLLAAEEEIPESIINLVCEAIPKGKKINCFTGESTFAFDFQNCKESRDTFDEELKELFWISDNTRKAFIVDGQKIGIMSNPHKNILNLTHNTFEARAYVFSDKAIPKAIIDRIYAALKHYRLARATGPFALRYFGLEPHEEIRHVLRQEEAAFEKLEENDERYPIFRDKLVTFAKCCSLYFSLAKEHPIQELNPNEDRLKDNLMEKLIPVHTLSNATKQLIVEGLDSDPAKRPDILTVQNSLSDDLKGQFAEVSDELWGIQYIF